MSAFSMRIGIGLYLYIFILSILFYFRLFYLYFYLSNSWVFWAFAGLGAHLWPLSISQKSFINMMQNKNAANLPASARCWLKHFFGTTRSDFAWTIFAGNWSVAAGVAEATGNMCGFCDVREHPSAATERWKIPLRYVYFHPTKAWKCNNQFAHPKCYLPSNPLHQIST